jgi:hypothetical protein
VVRDDFDDCPEAKEGLRAFAALKLDWPFRQLEARGPCHFFFDDERSPRLDVVRVDPAIPFSSFESIFRELESRFVDAEDLHRAETMVAKIFEAIVVVVAAK